MTADSRLFPSNSSTSPEAARVAVFSMRKQSRLVAYCMQYEFEDVVIDLTGADRIDAIGGEPLEWSRRMYKYARKFSGSRSMAQAIALSPKCEGLNRNYDLFFAVFNHIHELYSLASVPGWRRRTKFSACFVNEIQLDLAPPYLLEILNDFDHVFIADRYAVEPLSKLIGRPCTCLPLAVDVLLFTPSKPTPQRSIDVCSIGRRSPVTHASLLEAAEAGTFFYHYDTVEASGVDAKQRTFRVQDHREHRQLLGNLLKRSRYCFAYKGFVNDPAFTSGREEMSARFYEGAAAGAVMLGQAPNTDEFRGQFDWQDVVIDLPYDSPGVMSIIRELDRDPERVAQIRCENIANAALRHDWVYRLRIVLKAFDMQPTTAMVAREALLRRVAETVRE